MMARFMNAEDTRINLSSFKHPSINPPIIYHQPMNFYRGPVPSTNNKPDNVFIYYSNMRYRSQRTLQPNLSSTSSLG